MMCIYIALSLYGLMVWCPEYLKLLRAIEYEAQTKHFQGQYNDTTFSGSWENRYYNNSVFLNCKYGHIISLYLKKYNTLNFYIKTVM